MSVDLFHHINKNKRGTSNAHMWGRFDKIQPHFLKTQQTKNGNNDYKKPTVHITLNCEIHRISLLGLQNNKKIFSLSIRFNIVLSL